MLPWAKSPSVVAMAAPRSTIFSTLASSDAQLLQHRVINDHFATAHWFNKRDVVEYHAGDVHALSLYIDNGQNCARIDQRHAAGATGSLCLIPIGQQSRWQIDGDFEFAHLYFRDSAIRRFAAHTLDIEPRIVEVPDLTFKQDCELQQRCRQLFQASDADNLQLEESVNGILKHLLTRGDYCLNHRLKPSGGLSPSVHRRVVEYIESHFQNPISLAQLGEVAGLSEYHLQRMFRLSHGCSPSEYLLEVRIRRAREKLKGSQTLADIALSCGFSNQSHFNRSFRKRVGVSPGQYRRRLRGQ